MPNQIAQYCFGLCVYESFVSDLASFTVSGVWYDFKIVLRERSRCTHLCFALVHACRSCNQRRESQGRGRSRRLLQKMQKARCPPWLPICQSHARCSHCVLNCTLRIYMLACCAREAHCTSLSIKCVMLMQLHFDSSMSGESPLNSMHPLPFNSQSAQIRQQFKPQSLKQSRMQLVGKVGRSAGTRVGR